jgi:hypothetical protein
MCLKIILIKFHHAIPIDIVMAPFLLQPPLSELEIHVLWEPIGVSAQQAAKLPKGVDKPQNVSICMQHCVEISKENIFLFCRCFYCSKY